MKKKESQSSKLACSVDFFVAIEPYSLPMSQETAFDLAKEFFETKPAVRQALQHLETGVEIRVLLNDREEAALFYAVKQVHFEKRKAKNPDVQFILWPEALRRFDALPGENTGKLGIEIVKLIIAGHIKVSVVGSMWDIMGNGYLSVIKEAGPEFTGFLASHGLRGVGKILSTIRNLRQ